MILPVEKDCFADVFLEEGVVQGLRKSANRLKPSLARHLTLDISFVLRWLILNPCRRLAWHSRRHVLQSATLLQGLVVHGGTGYWMIIWDAAG